jgi:uncharacterized membrane protein
MATVERVPVAKVWRPSMAVVLVGVSLAITLPLAYVLNIWQDEAYTLSTTSGTLAHAFHQAVTFEQNAPLYFMLLVLWRHIDGSVFFLRLFSVLCAAATIALTPALARRYVPAIDARLVTVSVALNPFLIWTAVEMRVYAMTVFLSAVLLLTFYDAFLEERPRSIAPVAFAVCCIVALYTQYYLAFVIAGEAVALIVYRPQRLLKFLAIAVLCTIAFAPMLAIVPAEVRNFKGAFIPPRSVVVSAAILADILARYLLPLLVPFAKAVYGLIGVAAIVAAVTGRRTLRRDGNGTILVVTAAAFVAFAVVTYAGGVLILNRHAASLFVPVVLCVFAGFTYVRPAPLRQKLAFGWCAVVTIAAAVALVQTYAHLAKPGDWIRVTAYLHQNERAGEPIAIFEAENALPFAFYYDGGNAIVPVPNGVNYGRYDVAKFAVRNAGQVAATMPHARRLWLIEAGECKAANISFGCDIVDDFVRRHYDTESDAAFYGSRVRLLQAR